MKFNEAQTDIIGRTIHAAEAWLQGAGYSLFTQDQHECLADPTRAAEALGMLQHLRDRLGLPDRHVAPIVPVLVASMRESVDDNAQNFHALLDLQRDWIGHDEFDSDDQPEDIARRLREWIDNTAVQS